MDKTVGLAEWIIDAPPCLVFVCVLTGADLFAGFFALFFLSPTLANTEKQINKWLFHLCTPIMITLG